MVKNTWAYLSCATLGGCVREYVFRAEEEGVWSAGDTVASGVKSLYWTGGLDVVVSEREVVRTTTRERIM